VRVRVYHLLHFGWTDGGEHEHHGTDVHGGNPNLVRQPGISDVGHEGVQPGGVVAGVAPHALHRGGGEVARMHERPGIDLQKGEAGVTNPTADLFWLRIVVATFRV
jgi:hypothetical protein